MGRRRLTMDASAFQDLVEAVVQEVLQQLSDELGAHLRNVEIGVEDWPTREVLEAVGIGPGETLYGLYQGVPLTDRSVFEFGNFPDRIILYQGPIEASAGEDIEEMRLQIRKTVIHEIAHHYGISDQRLIELDAY